MVLARGFGLTDAIFHKEEPTLQLAQTVYGAGFSLAELKERLAYYEGWLGSWLLHLQLVGLG